MRPDQSKPGGPQSPRTRADDRGRLPDDTVRELVRLVQKGRRGGGPGAVISQQIVNSAEAQLVDAYSGLVCHIAKKMAARSPGEREDLESAGFEALVLAIRRVDTSKGRPLSSYFGTAIARAIRDEAWARCSRRESCSPDVLERLAARHTTSPAPTPELVALSQFAAGAGGFVVEDEVIEHLQCERLAGVLSHLGSEDLELLTNRYGLDSGRSQSQRKAASSFGISRKALRCREERILADLAAELGGRS